MGGGSLQKVLGTGHAAPARAKPARFGGKTGGATETQRHRGGLSPPRRVANDGFGLEPHSLISALFTMRRPAAVPACLCASVSLWLPDFFRPRPHAAPVA